MFALLVGLMSTPVSAIPCTTDFQCDDGIDCTDDTCDEDNNICINFTNDANCPDDSFFCNGDEFCDPVNDCSSSRNSCPPCSPACRDAYFDCISWWELYCDLYYDPSCWTGDIYDICENDYVDCLEQCPDDVDEDTILDVDDNCPLHYNPNQEDTDEDFVGNVCDNCPEAYNPYQYDIYPLGGNGIGEICECEGDFDCDNDCDGTDASLFKTDFGRSTFSNPCENGDPCNGDFDCDNDCDGSDAFTFKEDFGRSTFGNPCPMCEEGMVWCSYPLQ